MSYIEINLFAILVATGAGLTVGAVYWSLVRRRKVVADPPRRNFPVPLLVTALAAEFWLASILAGALILAPPRAEPWTMALGSAVVIWVGFVVPVLLVTHAFRELTRAEAVLDCAHWIAVMLVQAAILHSIGLTRSE